jgi:hypothetical protein
MCGSSGGGPDFDSDSLVACNATATRKYNGEPLEAAYGTQWAPDSFRNDVEYIQEPCVLTHFATQTAEGAALSASLNVLNEAFMSSADTGHYDEDGDIIDDPVIQPGPEFRKLLVLTDLEYLVKGVSQHIWKWENNGYMVTTGTPVKNGAAFKHLRYLIGQLEPQTKVYFWLIKK